MLFASHTACGALMEIDIDKVTFVRRQAEGRKEMEAVVNEKDTILHRRMQLYISSDSARDHLPPES